MTPFVINHLWQSSVFTALAGLLTFALRRLPARVRFWVWMSASLKFLVPFALLAAIGSHLPWHMAAPAAQPHALTVLTQSFSPADPGFIAPIPNGSVVQASTNPYSLIVLALWLTGLLCVVGYWIIRWYRISAAIRSAIPSMDGLAGFPAPVLLTDAAIEPGVFGIFRQVLLLPSDLGARLSGAQLQLVAAHERCHIRRRDNLWSLLHMLVEAVFWFHPLIWWLGGRLLAERELACDEAVLQDGADEEIYAQGILQVCRYYTGMPVACVSGIAGSDLTKRIAAIMSYSFAGKLSRTTRFGLECLAVAAVVAPVVVGMMNAPILRAQSGRSTAASLSTSGQSVAFDVAIVKLNTSGQTGSSLPPPLHGRFRATNVTFRMLLEYAYRAQDFQATGIEKWMDSNRYDVIAEVASDVSEDRNRLMVQTLLASQFKLAVHRESKESKVYTLSVDKTGVKMQRSNGECIPDDPSTTDIRTANPCGGFRLYRRSQLAGRRVTISDLIDVLEAVTGRYVVDKTGLAGAFDIQMQWSPDESLVLGPEGSAESGPSGASLFTALREQLGLRLESQRGSVPVVVVDHAEPVGKIARILERR